MQQILFATIHQGKLLV